MVSINIYWFIFKFTSTRICYKGYNTWYAETRVVHDVEQVQYHTIWADSLSKMEKLQYRQTHEKICHCNTHRSNGSHQNTMVYNVVWLYMIFNHTLLETRNFVVSTQQILS